MPGMTLIGLGMAILVAPLTTALMGSVPTRNAGLASAINNSVSRVGAPLVGALLFIAVNATFYPTLGSLVPGLDVQDPAIRALVQPFEQPGPAVPQEVADAAAVASAGAFHLAMAVAAGLVVAGALSSWLGLRPRPVLPRAAADPAATGSRPPRSPTEREDPA